jgi:hypothetical protein
MAAEYAAYWSQPGAEKFPKNETKSVEKAAEPHPAGMENGGPGFLTQRESVEYRVIGNGRFARVVPVRKLCRIWRLGGDVSEQLTTLAALAIIYARENRRRAIWTPNTLLERIGIAHDTVNFPASTRKKAARILRNLWRAGKLIRRIDLKRGGVHEAAYMRSEDKPPFYFEACHKCGFPRLVRHGMSEKCRKCAGEYIDESRYYASFPERPSQSYPIDTSPPTSPTR